MDESIPTYTTKTILRIIQVQFTVPHIPAIPERIQFGQRFICICQSAHENGLAPCVVLVFYHAAAADVNDSAASPSSCLTQRWPRTMHSAAPKAAPVQPSRDTRRALSFFSSLLRIDTQLTLSRCTSHAHHGVYGISQCFRAFKMVLMRIPH